MKGVVFLYDNSLLIHRRNTLLCKLLWLMLIADIVANLIIDPPALRYILPSGVFVCGILSLLVWQKLFVRSTMFLCVTLMYLFLFVIITAEPVLANYLFVCFALVASSLYHDYRPILYASILTAIFTSYCYTIYFDQIFPGSSPLIIYYLLLLDLFCTVLLIMTSKFAAGLLQNAARNEQLAQKQLRSNQAYLESFFNNTSDAIHVIDLEGTVLQVNSAYETMFGWSAAEVLGQSSKSIPEVLNEETARLFQHILSGKRINNLHTLRQRKDGSLFSASVTISPIRNDTGEVIALATISRDITELLDTTELLQKSEKLTMVGQLAAGVAHEIRNPLTTIKGFIQLMQANPGKPRAQYLNLMLSEVNRINSIVSELLVLAKPQVLYFQRHNILSILEDVLALINTQAIFYDIHLVTEFVTTNPWLDCEENQLKQVFINLIKNAIEAMAKSGEITIRVTNQGEELHIEITDQGCGIPLEQLSSLGEPFFSTKDSGTGLGLMVSQRIIANHHGTITYRSVVNQGTTVEVTLPTAQAS